MKLPGNDALSTVWAETMWLQIWRYRRSGDATEVDITARQHSSV